MSTLTQEPSDLWILLHWNWATERMDVYTAESWEGVVDLTRSLRLEEGRYAVCRGFPITAHIDRGLKLQLGKGESVFIPFSELDEGGEKSEESC